MRKYATLDTEEHHADGGKAVDIWARFVRENLCPISTQIDTHKPFRVDADITRFQQFSILHAGTHFGSMSITSAAPAQQTEDSDRILVSIPLEGRQRVSQFGNSGYVGKNDLFALSLADEFELHKLDDSEVIYLLMPRRYAEINLLDPQSLCGRPISAKEGMPRLARDTIVALWRSAKQIQQKQFAIAVRSACDLALLALSGDDASQSSTATVVEANCAKAKRYICHNVAEPHLAPETVAAACGFSVRYLHLVFEDDAETVASYIRRQRLESAYALLKGAHPGTMTVLDACHASGFTNSSHFSRVFRQRYGDSPRAVLLSSPKTAN